MVNAKRVALASMLLLALPSTGAAQQAANGPWASAAARLADADSGSVPPREPRDRTSRFVVGTVSGALLGASGGSVYGHQNYEPCEVDCYWDRGHEAFLFAILGGIGGGVLGGLTGWFWPDRPAHPVGMGLAPTRRSVSVSLSVRH